MPVREGDGLVVNVILFVLTAITLVFLLWLTFQIIGTAERIISDLLGLVAFVSATAGW